MSDDLRCSCGCGVSAEILVVVPYFRSHLRFGECLRSLRAQDTHGFHVLIIADGDVLPKKFPALVNSDFRMSTFGLGTNHGHFFAREVARRANPLPFIAFVDADDYIDESWLRILTGSAQLHGAAFSRVRWFESLGAKEQTVRQQDAALPTVEDRINMRYFAHHNGVYKASRLKQIGGYDPSFRFGYDSLLIHLVGESGEIGIENSTSYHYRYRDLSNSESSLTNDPLTGKGSQARQQIALHLESRWKLFLNLREYEFETRLAALARWRDEKLDWKLAAYSKKLLTLLEQTSQGK